MNIFNASNATIVKTVEEWYKRSRRETRGWRNDTREDFEFYAGEQWTEPDKLSLKRNDRPIVTFNRVAPTIDAVSGAERSNRQETRYLPRTVSTGEAPQDDDRPVAEMWTEVSRWVRDGCDAEDEESHAYEDALICGLGWTETYVNYDEDPDGQLVVERKSPLSMYFDPDAVKRNLSDARFCIHVKPMALVDVKELWPGKPLRGLAESTFTIDNIDEPHHADQAKYYVNDQAGRRTGRNEVMVAQCQWYERTPVYRMVNPETGQTEFLTAEERQAVFDALGYEMPSVRQVRKTFYQAFVVGKTLLEKAELHVSDDGEICPGFTFQAITGKRDERKNQWFGLMRAMKDPQRWANKFFSQIQDIMNSQAKGGILAEVDAFEDKRKAEQDWARPDRIIWLNSGALTNKKIEQRNAAGVPSALDRLLIQAIGAVRDVSGVNIEMLGSAARTQSGIVEQSRIHQSLMTLAVFFDSLRRYRKMQGRVLFHMMRTYLPDSMLVRIVGTNQYVRFAKEEGVGKYDLIVDQSPVSPSFKQEVWAAMQQILPALASNNVPIPWMEILKYTPLPYSVQADLQKFIEAQQPSAEQRQQQQALGQLQIEKLQAEIMEIASSAEENKASAFAQVFARFNDRMKIEEQAKSDARQARIDSDRVAVDSARTVFETLSKIEGSTDVGQGGQPN